MPRNDPLCHAFERFPHINLIVLVENKNAIVYLLQHFVPVRFNLPLGS